MKIVGYLSQTVDPDRIWVIADDVRYLNEAERIQELGGIVLFLEPATHGPMGYELNAVKTIADQVMMVDPTRDRYARPRFVKNLLDLLKADFQPAPEPQTLASPQPSQNLQAVAAPTDPED